MPRIRRRGHRQNTLTEAQFYDLFLGGPAAFSDEMTRRQAWNVHRDELMVDYPRTVPLAHRQYEMNQREATRCRE